MVEFTNASGQAARLRRQAEKTARIKGTEEPGYIESQTPEEVRQTLHELLVHQIELEMQNEELRRAQVELDASRARYFDLFDLAPVGYLTLNENGLIREANLTAAGLLGVARKTLFKQILTPFILEEDQDIYYLYRKQLFKTGEPQDFDLWMHKKDGTVFCAHLTAIIAQDPSASSAQDTEGARFCHVALFDITERKQTEKRIQLLNIELERLALTDYLTNLYNRRFFMQRGVEEIKRARRSGLPLALLMIDIDEFKSVNDNYGHETGDLALRQVAEDLKSGLREIDILGRLGGDEFGVLLPNTPLPDAAMLAERIRFSIAQLVFQSPEHTSIRSITISIGVADLTAEISGFDNLLKHADLAMYQAKNNGRNNVVVY